MRTRLLVLGLVAACGGSDPQPSSPPAASGSSSSGQAPTASGTGAGPAPSAVSKAEPAYEAKTPAEALALDLLTKRESIGWNAAKKRIAYSAETHDGKAYALTIGFREPKGTKDVDSWDACGPCAGLEKQLGQKVPELAKKLDGYASLPGVSLTATGRADLPGSEHSIGFEGGKVTFGTKGSKATRILGTLKAAAPHKPTLERAWFVTEAKLIVGRVLMDPAEGSGGQRYQQLHMFPMQ